ncbi:MAG: 7-cyano-7-deazaguanine synthase [Phycisphaerales bacterium JB043]
MDRQEPRTLLIDDGGVLSLLAGYLQPEQTVAHVWLSWSHGASLAHRHNASKRHATLLGATWSQNDFPYPMVSPASESSHGLELSRMLMSAGSVASERGCDRVIWATCHGEDVEGMSRDVDRARLIEHVWNLDMTGDEPSLLLELPLVDLTLPQLADLAIDLEVPLDACWDCLGDNDQTCGACPGCLEVEDVYARRGAVASGSGALATRAP